jgi:biopolymer transport protein TolQ
VILLQAAPPEEAVTGSLFSLARANTFETAILLSLLLFSLLSWTIIVRKWLTFRAIDRQSRSFIAFFRKSPRLSEVSSACEHYPKTPLSGIFAAAYQELNAQLQAVGGQPRGSGNPGNTALNERNLTGIQRSIFRASAAELSVLEKSMSWLATTASVTPFIGLLGTVVGIISAFQGLGIAKTASIQAVAPGISAALWATAAGLFAAIPAVVAYNQYVHRIKEIGSEMDDFSAELMNLIERSFV